jgi:hypothetical protein
MRLHSSDAVVLEARKIAHSILQTYHDPNRSKEEIRDLLESGSVDLFSRFGDACRAELDRLHPNEPRSRSGLRLRHTPLATMVEIRRSRETESRQCG